MSKPASPKSLIDCLRPDLRKNTISYASVKCRCPDSNMPYKHYYITDLRNSKI